MSKTAWVWNVQEDRCEGHTSYTVYWRGLRLAEGLRFCILVVAVIFCGVKANHETLTSKDSI